MDTAEHHPGEVVIDVAKTWLSSSCKGHLCPRCDSTFVCLLLFFYRIKNERLAMKQILPRSPWKVQMYSNNLLTYSAMHSLKLSVSNGWLHMQATCM